MFSRRIFSGMLAVSIFAQTCAPFAARAADFDPNNVLNDALLRRHDAMSYAEIRDFLAAKGGLDKVSDVDPIDGVRKSASRLIFDASQRYHVNPQYLLALIQKESSGVEADAPTAKKLEWAAGYALCDGCYKSAPLAKKYRGFARQVDAGAGWIDWYFKNTDAQIKKAGSTYKLDAKKITPQNVATAALYAYTPHIHGNLLLWTIWNRWFGDGSPGLQLPDGALARDTKTGAVALWQHGKFRPFENTTVLEARFAGRVPVRIDHGAFEAFLARSGGSPVKFSDWSLVRDGEGATFLIDGAMKRRIPSTQTFTALGFNPEEVEDVSDDDIADYTEGAPITDDNADVSGELLQDEKTGGVYFVIAGEKHPLLDRALLAVNFAGRTVRRVSPFTLDPYPTGAPVLLDDGALVKAAGDAGVYVISEGRRRAIPSEQVFLTLGYSWSSVQSVSKKLLELHPVGAPVALELAQTAASGE